MNPGSKDTQMPENGEAPAVAGLRSWRAVYAMVLGVFVLYLIVLTWLSRAFS